jgi:hypothetical protein
LINPGRINWRIKGKTIMMITGNVNDPSLKELNEFEIIDSCLLERLKRNLFFKITRFTIKRNKYRIMK